MADATVTIGERRKAGARSGQIPTPPNFQIRQAGAQATWSGAETSTRMMNITQSVSVLTRFICNQGLQALEIQSATAGCQRIVCSRAGKHQFIRPAVNGRTIGEQLWERSFKLW